MSDYLFTGMSGTAHSMALCAFRVLFATAVLVKFVADHRTGGWDALRPGRFVRYRHELVHPRLTPSPRTYHLLYVAKFVAAGCLLGGVFPNAAALVLALWLFYELTFDHENHTTLLACFALVLATSSNIGDCLTWRTALAAIIEGPEPVLTRELGETGDPFPQLLIVVLVTQMYLATAWRKIRSADFRSGRLLHRVAEHLTLITPELPWRQSWFPRWFVRRYAIGDHDVLSARWRPAAVATISLEVVVPVLLWFPITWPFAAVAGVGMHICFGFLLPARLASFGLATVGSYLLFASPLMAS